MELRFVPVEDQDFAMLTQKLDEYYLEVVGEDDEYGPVNGLFTLALLNANPGEGGGFVYGSILESTGDFICETKDWVFARAEVSSAEQFAQQLAAHGKLYTRVSGKAYQTAKEYVAGMHSITTRYLRCPHCGKKSFCKRRLTH